MHETVLNWPYLLFGDGFSWWLFVEAMTRIGILFTCTLIIFHFFYKRDLVDFTSTDLIVVLALGTIIGDTAFYRTIPLVHALFAIFIIVILARIITYMIGHSERLARIVNGKTTLLIRDGQLEYAAIKRLDLPLTELFSLLRLRGIRNTGQVAYAFLEANGQLSIILHEGPAREGVSTIEPIIKQNNV